MPVSVVMPNSGANERNIEILGTALSLARDFYKVKMDDKALDAANKFKQAEIDAQSAATALANEKKSQSDEVAFAEKFASVPEGTKGALTLPNKSGLFLPRADIRAEASNKTALASKSLDQQSKASDKDFTRTQSLSNEYNRDSKETVLAVDGYKKIKAAALNPNPSGATDITLLFGFMKTIDPGSTVREGEFANAENAQGVSGKVAALYNKVVQGERLTPEARLQFLTEAERSLQSRLTTQEQIDKRYTAKSENFKVNPTYVVNSDFQELKKELGDLNLGGRNETSPQQGGFGTAYGSTENQTKMMYQPGSIITVLGKRAVVNADGNTATPLE